MASSARWPDPNPTPTPTPNPNPNPSPSPSPDPNLSPKPKPDPNPKPKPKPDQGNVVVETATAGLPSGVLVFQPDGNLVLYPSTSLYELAAVQALTPP